MYKIKILTLVILPLLAISLFPSFGMGSTIENSADDISKLAAFSYADHNIKFVSLSGANDPSDTITVTFPTGFDLSEITPADLNLSHGGSTGTEIDEIISTSPNSTDWGMNIVNQRITLSHPTDPANGNISASDKINIRIGKNTLNGFNQINNGAAGNYTIIIGGTFGDNGQIPIVILDNDQISAGGDVIATISLTLSSHSTSSFGLVDLGTIAASTPNITLTISTNHASGYSLTVQDSGDGTHPGLYKTAGETIPAQLIGSADPNYSDSVDLNSVITGYGIQARCLSGCDTNTEIIEKYRKTTDTIVAGLKTSADLLMEYHAYLSVDHVVEIRHVVKASQYAKTGQYLDQITYQATANF